MRKTLEQRFWEKVKKGKPNDCWEWQAYRNLGGYGVIGFGASTQFIASRLSYELHFGKILKNLLVLHKCDNPSCVNPNHLFLGTPKDNVDDMLKKGRGNWAKGAESGMRLHPEKVLRGEEANNTKLTWKEVREIREKYVPWKYTMKELAEEYSVGDETISYIITRKTWKE